MLTWYNAVFIFKSQTEQLCMRVSRFGRSGSVLTWHSFGGTDGAVVKAGAPYFWFLIMNDIRQKRLEAAKDSFDENVDITTSGLGISTDGGEPPAACSLSRERRCRYECGGGRRPLGGVSAHAPVPKKKARLRRQAPLPPRNIGKRGEGVFEKRTLEEGGKMAARIEDRQELILIVSDLDEDDPLGNFKGNVSVRKVEASMGRE
ncbi:hypothetical protein NDU88_003346 [Pleurodeles waltl]|uniref:Uncharacterized protein n=1 Tax=Pleurodeles waltl TaxID=8319 RepID=A0AAV7TNB5_PLEWA|nr:hypothetical protein NDU88_003346 [Pleurodeles waltl]